VSLESQRFELVRHIPWRDDRVRFIEPIRALAFLREQALYHMISLHRPSPRYLVRRVECSTKELGSTRIIIVDYIERGGSSFHKNLSECAVTKIFTMQEVVTKCRSVHVVPMQRRPCHVPSEIYNRRVEGTYIRRSRSYRREDCPFLPENRTLDAKTGRCRMTTRVHVVDRK
jgi:hypothetical protein